MGFSHNAIGLWSIVASTFWVESRQPCPVPALRARRQLFAKANPGSPSACNYLGVFPRPQVRVLEGQFVLGMLIALFIEWKVDHRHRVYRQNVQKILRRNKIRNWRVGRW
jgi:hypothetical protein